MKIVEILKAIRTERQLSQDDLAESTGLARTYISRLENYKFDPRLGTLERIASKGLGASLDEVIYAYRKLHNDTTPPSAHSTIRPKRSNVSVKTLTQIKKLLAQLEKEARR